MGFKPTQVAKLLGTANDQEQAQRILALQQPVACINILYDPRTDAIGLGVVGGPITYEALRLILHRVIERSIKEEAAAGGIHPRQAATATAPAPLTSLPGDPVAPEN